MDTNTKQYNNHHRHNDNNNNNRLRLRLRPPSITCLLFLGLSAIGFVVAHLFLYDIDTTTTTTTTTRTITTTSSNDGSTTWNTTKTRGHYTTTTPSSKASSSKKNPTTPTKQQKQQQKIVRFVPYPHNDLGVEVDAACEWRAFDDDTNDPIAASLLGGGGTGSDSSTVIMKPDNVQRNALQDTICLPKKRSYSHQNHHHHELHLFSSEQARQCLSDISLRLTGDSYTKQLYIGLAEILLGEEHSNTSIVGSTYREFVLQQYIGKIKTLNNNNNNNNGTKTMIDLKWECRNECDGRYKFPFWLECSNCINELRRNRNHNNNTTSSSGESMKKPIVNVVGTGIHIYHHHEALIRGNNNKSAAADATVKEFVNFLNATATTTTDNNSNSNSSSVILVSGPKNSMSGQPFLTLDEYRNYNGTVRSDRVYWKIVQEWFNNKQQQQQQQQQHWQQRMRYLDVYQLTGSCYFENCTGDGSHRDRFVNRWKAQLLLNTLCSYD